MNANQEADVRLWVINRIAEVLVDLADDPDDDEAIDPEQLFDDLKQAAEVIVEALNIKVVSSDGMTATVTLGDG
jgi:hypothetical protein